MSAAVASESAVIVECPSCGQKNRVPFEHLGQTGTCGRCKSALPPPNAPMEIASERQFDDLVAKCPLPVVVDYWAPWCGPCRMVAPEIAKVAAAHAGQ